MGELKPSLKIYCRIAPLDDPSDFGCVVQKDENTIILNPLDGVQKPKKGKDVCYSFQHVFNEETTQKEIFDHVAYPLVQDLLQGESGLIFTHGITSSGKTYTMSGTPEDEGLIPRCLDVIFNTIGDCQASKFVFKPNKLNGFMVQSTAEALMDQQKTLGIFSRTSTPKRSESIGEWSDRVSDSYIVDSISVHRKYSVFISYVEVHNNYIYDLLEDFAMDRKYKNRSSKMLKEDSANNMYVLGAEVREVKTANEALELFCKGQERKKFSNTNLNRKSSRSHTVFTIRVVQAPVDSRDSEIEQNQDNILISQISFVDLASCERRLESQNGARKPYGAESKNTTLTALNSCIEALKKLQDGKASEVIPYRKSKLTHLFKTFFEGKGGIRMIVCLNPRLDDCIETAKFMKFAKTTETFPSKTVPKALARESSISDAYREAIKKAKQQGVRITEILVPDVHADLPQLITTFDDEPSYANLIEILNRRKLKRKSMKQDLKKQQDEFLQKLVALEKENIHLKENKTLLEMDLQAREQQLHGVEHKLLSAEQMIDNLEKDLMKVHHQLEGIRKELHSKNKIISDQAKEIECAKTRMKEKIACEKHRLKRTMERRLAAKQTEIERKMCFNAERFRQLREILNTDDGVNIEDVVPDAELSTETLTSLTEASEEKSGNDKCWSSNGRFISRKKRKTSNTRSVQDIQPVCKTKGNSQLDRQSKKKSPDLHLYNEYEIGETIQSISSPVESQQTSSPRAPIKKLSTFLTKKLSTANVPRSVTTNTNTSTTSFRHAVYQYLLRGSCSMFSRAKRSSNLSLSKLGLRKSNSDDVWIEHCPIGNLELNDFVPPILKKRTVSSLTTKDVTKNDASHYVLQHQEMDNNGEMVVELYKADIIPSTGGGAQVVFKDVVKMLKNLPPRRNLKRLNNDCVPLNEVAERCTISIECRGIPSRNAKKK